MKRSTVNPSELEHFGKLAEEWWDPDGNLRNLELMNKIRIPLIEPTINRKSSGRKRILDLGCGGGYLSEGLARRFHDLGWEDKEIEVLGLEPSPEGVLAANAHLPSSLKGKVSYHCDVIENYVEKNPNERFDTVVMSEVIEHVDNPEEFLRHAVDATKPGGSIILTTPSRTMFGWFIMLFCAEYLLGTIPYGTHEYRKLFSQQEIVQMFKNNGCEVKEPKGIFFNPVTRQWSMNDWMAACFAVHAIKR